jgi:hypothetical protein
VIEYTLPRKLRPVVEQCFWNEPEFNSNRNYLLNLSDMFTDEQKQHAIHLIEMGEKIKAIKYIRESLNVSLEEALKLTEKLEEEVKPTPFRLNFNEARRQRFQQAGINIGKLVGSIFMGVGVLLLTIAAWFIVSNNQFEKRAKHVKGKVIDYSSYDSRDDDGDYTTMYSPVFEYEFKGKTYTYTSSTGSSGKDYKIGERVEVLVDPENPEEVLVNSFIEKWLVALILGIMGLAFSGFGFLALRIFGK